MCCLSNKLLQVHSHFICIHVFNDKAFMTLDGWQCQHFVSQPRAATSDCMPMASQNIGLHSLSSYGLLKSFFHSLRFSISSTARYTHSACSNSVTVLWLLLNRSRYKSPMCWLMDTSNTVLQLTHER